MKFATLILLLFATVALGATDQLPIDPSDDFSPGLGLFALFAIIALLILVGVGIVCAALIVASLAVITALGIVSSAALLGFYRRRLSSGLRAFHYQVCAIAALPAGIGVLWLGAHFFSLHLRHRDILTIGSITGICGGLLLAFTFDRLVSITYRRFVTPRIPHITGNA